MTDKEYLTVEEAREHIKVSRWKMAQLLDKGEIPFQQSPWDKRVKLIKRVDLLAWVESAGPRPERKKQQGSRPVLALAH